MGMGMGRLAFSDGVFLYNQWALYPLFIKPWLFFWEGENANLLS